MGAEPAKHQPLDPASLRLEIETMREELGYPAFSDGADIAYVGELDVAGKNGEWLHPQGGLDHGLCTSIQFVNPIAAPDFKHAMRLWMAIQEGLRRPSESPADYPGMRPILNEIDRGEFPGDIGSTLVEPVPGESHCYFIKYPHGEVETQTMIKIEQPAGRNNASNNFALLALLAVRNLEIAPR